MGSDLPKVTVDMWFHVCPVPGDKDKGKHCLCPHGTDDPMEEKDTK